MFPLYVVLPFAELLFTELSPWFWATVMDVPFTISDVSPDPAEQPDNARAPAATTAATIPIRLSFNFPPVQDAQMAGRFLALCHAY
jgi:hypothetical protein